MKRTVALLLLLPLLAWALPGAAETLPAGARALCEGAAEGALFLPDGRAVVVPAKRGGGQPLPPDEVRCLDAEGRLLWTCAFPAGRLPWGGPHLLSDGRIAFVTQRAGGARALEILSRDGRREAAVPMPDQLKPLIVSGDRVYGTQEGQDRDTPCVIGLGGRVRRAPILHSGLPDGRVVWSWPRDDGRLLLLRDRLRPADGSGRRVGAQGLALVDASGAVTRTAQLMDRELLDGFGMDAVPNGMGGLTALVMDNPQNGGYNAFWIYGFDAQGLPVWQRRYALDSAGVRAQLIDRGPDGGYTVWGRGERTEDGQSGFVFRMETDALGNALALDARACDGGSAVRCGGGVRVYHAMQPLAWLAPFDALPRMDMPLPAHAPAVADREVGPEAFSDVGCWLRATGRTRARFMFVPPARQEGLPGEALQPPDSVRALPQPRYSRTMR